MYVSSVLSGIPFSSVMFPDAIASLASDSFASEVSITCLFSKESHQHIPGSGVREGVGTNQVPRHEEVKEGGGITIRLLALQSSGGNRIFQSAIGQGFFHKARGVALGKAETQGCLKTARHRFASSNGFACSARLFLKLDAVQKNKVTCAL